MGDVGRRIETVANCVTIVTLIILCTVLLRVFVSGNGPVSTPSAGAVSAGERLSIPNVEWDKWEKTLVLVVQKGCQYCTDSAPFYRKIARLPSIGKSVRLIAISPQSPEDTREYMVSLGVQVNETYQVDFKSMHIKATPCLLLVDRSGKIELVVFGKVPTRGEEEIVERLR